MQPKNPRGLYFNKNIYIYIYPWLVIFHDIPIISPLNHQFACGKDIPIIITPEFDGFFSTSPAGQDCHRTKAFVGWSAQFSHLGTAGPP